MSNTKLYSHGYDLINQHLFEMATVKGGFMSIKLAIFGSEGPIPHFHFYKGIAPEESIPNNGSRGGGCLCMDRPLYFNHGSHKETLSSKEIKGLIKFLQEPNKRFKSISNWVYLIGLWNDNNPTQTQLPMNIPIPDYKSDMGSVSTRGIIRDLDVMNMQIDD